MITEIFELESILTDLTALSDTFIALEIAQSDSRTVVPKQAWALPCSKLRSLTKEAAEQCEALFERLHELQGGKA